MLSLFRYIGNFFTFSLSYFSNSFSLGLFLTDLTFIEEGNPNLIEGLINFSKRKKMANVIREIQQYQNIPYVFEPVERIQKWLKEAAIGEENELYRLSLAREPRNSANANTS